MSSTVSKFVARTLCKNEGSLDFKRLDEILGQHFTLAESVLRGILCDDGTIAIKAGREKGPVLSPDSVIVAKTSLRLCQSPPGDCPQCDKLHICRYFVCGNCRFGNKCKNSHSVSSPHNVALLTSLGLQDFSEQELCGLLLQNDPYLLPEICPHYNKGNGEHGSCRFTTACTNLHLCLHFVQGDCRFGPACKRAHTFDAHVMKILTGRGFSPENVGNLFKIYRNKFIILGQQERPAPLLPPVVSKHGGASAPVRPPVVNERGRQLSGGSTRPPHSPTAATSPISEADGNEICLYFIRRHCSFKEKCVRVHYHLPYKWQVLDSDGVSWKDLPDMEDIEKAYCDPEQDTSSNDQLAQTYRLFGFLSIQPSSPPSGKKSVNFLTMDYKGSPVRRLSTASSVSKPPHFILTTQWLWYWKDEGDWVEYGHEAGGDTSASVTSQTLENVYLADTETEIPFGAGKHKYILHFKGMYQQNTQYQTKREIRRRPRFVSAQGVETKLKSLSSESSGSSSTAVAVPSHWDETALPGPGSAYKLVPLSGSVKEYKMVEKLFRSTMPSRGILSIKRIQNPSLWRVFQWQKEQMKERSGGKPVDERYLFHGTDESLIDAICEQNFDWRICGVHGTLYGKGSYFAKDASYSDRYASVKGTRKKVMFVALILVGDYTKGNGNLLRPPAKRTGQGFYDSCVDSEGNPSIFVVFEKHQIYPEYIIEYS